MAEEEKQLKRKSRRKVDPEIGEATITGYVVGYDKKVIDPNQVKQLAALGCNDSEIGRFFGIADDTLRFNFFRELELGRAEMKITLRRSMLDNACTKYNPAVQIFLAKNFLGMSDVPLNTEANKPLPWDDNF